MCSTRTSQGTIGFGIERRYREPAPRSMSEPQSPAAAAPAEHRLHTSQLAGLIARLQHGLTRQGVGPDESSALLASSLSARCVSCGIELSGEELLQLVAPVDPSVPSSHKLERLKQGYCARTGCDSYFANLSLLPTAGVDWGKLLAETDTITAARADQPAAPRSSHWRKQKVIRI